MRPVLHGDVSCAARALLLVPDRERAGFCQELIRQADAADQFVQQFRRLHPRWGNGSLMSSARQHRLPSEPSFDDDTYCRCFEIVLNALRAFRSESCQPEAQDTQSRQAGSSSSRL